MTVNTEYFTNYQDGRQPGAPFDKDSPNLMALNAYLLKRWGGLYLGCYGVRPVRSGQAWSSHAFGAAIDWRYMNPGAGRAKLESEILPFLIDNSKELGIQAIHDYVGCRIWRSNRGDGQGAYWKTQTKDSAGMGQSWAGWLHIEVDAHFWGDARPVEEKLQKEVVVPAPTIKRGTAGPNVLQLSTELIFLGLCNGKPTKTCTLTLERGIKRLQKKLRLTPDGVYGPATAARYKAWLKGTYTSM